MSDPFERLNAIADILVQVVRAPELVAEKAAPKIAEKMEEQAELGLDPYGARWAPLADGSASYLYDSGDMREGTDAVSAGATIIATAPSPAEFHQHGTHRMPARPVLPNEEQGLPQSWQEAIDEAKAEVEKEIRDQVDAA